MFCVGIDDKNKLVKIRMNPYEVLNIEKEILSIGYRNITNYSDFQGDKYITLNSVGGPKELFLYNNGATKKLNTSQLR